MKESSTYQAIVEEGIAEGALKEARKLLFQLGTKQLGQPNARTLAALAKIIDLERIEALLYRLVTPNSWRALLEKASADRKSTQNLCAKGISHATAIPLCIDPRILEPVFGPNGPTG